MAPDHLTLYLGHRDPTVGGAQVAPGRGGRADILNRDGHYPDGQGGRAPVNLRGAGGRGDHPDRCGDPKSYRRHGKEGGEAHQSQPCARRIRASVPSRNTNWW